MPGLLVGLCTLAAAPPAGAASPPARQMLLRAQRRLDSVAAHASTGAVRASAGDAARQLARATGRSLWIDARQIVAPPYGTRVFTDTAAAAADLERSPAAGIAAIASRIAGVDARLAGDAIASARGGNNHLLSGARRQLAAGTRQAALGDPVAAVSAYETAWKIAFRALARLAGAKATGVPPAALAAAAEEALGSPTIGLAGPTIKQNQPPLMRAGKPEMFFAGSEACPFCAVQRWGMIVALSQFGTFSKLHLLQSATIEPPSIRTFTFLGSSYRSPYIAFVPVEVFSNVPTSVGYAHLQRLTPGEKALLKAYDQPGQTPFIDVGNRFITVGSTVPPTLIAGRSWSQVGRALADPLTTTAQAIDGEAEVMTAEVCEATNGNPRTVCSSPVVQQYEAALPFLNGRGGGCPGAAVDAAADRRGGESPFARTARCHI